jgi:hypothetical protein
MTEKDAFSDRERWLEEEYFRKKQEELIERMRRKVALESKIQELGRALNITDRSVLEALLDLGYTPDLARLAYFVPLVQVAWADGKVSHQERGAILEFARKSGIEEGSLAETQLKSWLDQRPSDEFFSVSLLALQAIIAALPKEEQEAARERILADAKAIAATTGGVLGLGNKISDAEQEAIERIAAELAPES